MKTNAILRGGDDGTISMVKALDLAGSSVAASSPVEPKMQPNPLEQEITRLRDALAASEAKHSVIAARAREHGREDALAGFKRDEAASLAALQTGIASAQATFHKQLQSLEQLSLVISDTALTKVLADPKRRSELISGGIQQQIKLVKTNSVVAIRVSPADFPDRQVLAQLATRIGVAPEVLQQNADLRSGDCEIGLRLGKIEFSVSDYLKHLRQALADAAGQTQAST